jgi:ABC-type phosphate/phosphonate transport system substrate-binding protein
VPTDVPVGAARRPLHLAVVQVSSGRSPQAVSAAAANLGKTLLDKTELTIQVDLVNNDAEALAALCGSADGAVTAAWLNGIAYAAAYAQGCGTAGVQVQRGTLSAAKTGDEARIYVNPDAKISSMTDLDKKTYCRIRDTDLYSWLVPLMMMSAGGFTSAGNLQAIRDYDDPAQMIADTLAGTCDAMGIAGSQFDEIASASARSTLTVLQQSATIPYAVLVYPPQVLSDAQQKISSALVSIGSGSDANIVKALLEQDEVIAVTDSDFTSLRAFIRRAGIDLAQAGS